MCAKIANRNPAAKFTMIPGHSFLSPSFCESLSGVSSIFACGGNLRFHRRASGFSAKKDQAGFPLETRPGLVTALHHLLRFNVI
jgi:hypothetical protein